jgi:hypothetical protein
VRAGVLSARVVSREQRALEFALPSFEHGPGLLLVVSRRIYVGKSRSDSGRIALGSMPNILL